MYFVYILQSEKDKRFYVGLTSDIEKRVRSHNLGRVKSTSHRRPFRLIYKESYFTRTEARDREKYFKSYKGSREKLSIIDSILGKS